ncbi:hypothetical protein E2C01_065293 [Portunus trituberculatus]|uniref:Uncharacterized protein n=1 Tax=Portunus trituberculatus TaxID=210409 RepID=A0A5B7HM62_PORTR|nr:hypothetical protein [Portunus trituberculatus]
MEVKARAGGASYIPEDKATKPVSPCGHRLREAEACRDHSEAGIPPRVYVCQNDRDLWTVHPPPVMPLMVPLSRAPAGAQ